MAKLLFIMTPGVNLSVWRENGSFSREIKPYVAYADAGWQVEILTFGAERYDFRGLHKNISFRNVGYSHLRSLIMPFKLVPIFKRFDIIKTNQSYYSWIFVLAAKLAKRPVLLRCGYVYGEYLESVNGLTLKTRIYKVLEKWAYKNAVYSTVPTRALLDWIINNYGLSPHKISVLPNFVDTDVFRPCMSGNIDNSVIAVGRLEPVKRFELLVQACARLPGCRLTIIGEGSERPKLAALASKLGLTLAMPGNVPNGELPAILCRHKIFALTSKREGHPKALIEAMACAIPCVGSFQGQDNFSGVILTALPVAEEIAGAINEFFSNAEKMKDYSQRGLDFALRNYAFPGILRSENKILNDLIYCAK